MAINQKTSSPTVCYIHHDKVPYTLIRSKRKTLCIQINKDAQLIVRAPLTLSRRSIDSFLKQNEEAIVNRLFQCSQIKDKRDQFTVSPGDSLLYLGKSYPVISWDGDSVQFNKRAFLFPSVEFSLLKPSLIDCYRALAKEYIEKRVHYFAPKMNVSPAKVKVGRALTRWGSCSSKGNLNFSFLLMMAPEGAVDYVVVHELAHLKQMNHSPLFWQLVESILPDYRLRKRKLDQLQQVLTEQNWKLT